VQRLKTQAIDGKKGTRAAILVKRCRAVNIIISSTTPAFGNVG
jgi:hypothetical protein